MGLTVVGLGLLDICLWFGALWYLQGLLGFEMSLAEITVTMLCFGMGASAQALFARVGGGIFTKAADVGADLVTLNAMLRIPVDMCNVPQDQVFRPTMWDRYANNDYLVCRDLGPLYV